MLDLNSIYKEYAQFVYRYLYSLCHNEEIAEELTQETFYQAVKSSHRYNGSCKVSTWLCQIAKHLWYQEIDHRKRRETVPIEEDVPSRQESVETQFCQKENIMNIFKKIHILDETSKEVFLLRLCGNLSFREIGEIFEKNENWARVTFYRAKQKIVKGWDE